MLEPQDVGFRLKELRKTRKLSMRSLASMAGVSVSFISKIEGGNASPTLTTLVKLLEALGVRVPEFFTDATNENEDVIVHRHDAMRVLDDGDKCWRYMFPHHPGIKVVMTYEEYRPHTKNKEPESHPADICGLVLNGVLTLDLANKQTLEIKSGDSFYIKAGTVHTSSNKSSEKLILAVVEVPIPQNVPPLRGRQPRA